MKTLVTRAWTLVVAAMFASSGCNGSSVSMSGDNAATSANLVTLGAGCDYEGQCTQDLVQQWMRCVGGEWQADETCAAEVGVCAHACAPDASGWTEDCNGNLDVYCSAGCVLDENGGPTCLPVTCTETCTIDNAGNAAIQDCDGHTTACDCRYNALGQAYCDYDSEDDVG